MLRRLLTGTIALLALPTLVPANVMANDADALAFFEKRVRPILVDNCYTCHSANTNSKGGLRVDDRNGLLVGGNSGPAVVPGQPDKSLLIKRLRHADPKLKMPVESDPLTDEQVADLTKWVRDGAVWPKVRVPADLGKSNAEYEKLRKSHWAWQPLRESKVPGVSDATWARDDVDRFVLANLAAKGLKPTGDADRVTLLRRVTFDLTGLPPTPEEIDAFVKDESADAWEKVVDRLLASPGFGERWGRHWLDVARYGESTGSSRNMPYPHAWRYRDYVVDAVNRDVPYDRFITEQLAGDLLPADTNDERDRLTVATGFLALGVKDVNQRFKVRFVMDNIDEQIDTVTRSVLALTASCARCHDHKFDPIPATDYYALAGIFHSTDLCAGVRSKMGGGGLDYYDNSMLMRLSTAPPPTDPAKLTEATAAYEKAKKEWDAIRGTAEGLAKGPDGLPKQRPFRLRFDKAQADLAELTDPAAKGHAALGVRDAKSVGDTEVRIRGEAEKLGPTVPRGFLSLVDVPDAPKVNAGQSGRRELAAWLTSPKNPLTSRVMANRVWHHLFGQGIVSSVDNFGVTGDVPANPDLLDHVAGRFVQDGWSVKKLVRSLVLTRAYRLSAESVPANVSVDPANRLVWRHLPRRLTAEEIRDATLSAAGTLSRTRPESPAKELRVIEMRNNGPEARKIAEHVAASTSRSVYLPLLRGLTPRSLEVFDFAEQGMVTGSRDTTTVAPQALYLLNDPFVLRQSAALAERVLRSTGNDDARIENAYRLTLGRTPTAKELEQSREFVAEFEKVVRDLPPPTPKVVEKVVEKPKPATPVNPDEIDRTDETLKEEVTQPSDPKVAAWASFCQALLGSAEFRYVR